MRKTIERADKRIAATWGTWRTGVIMGAVGLLAFQLFHVLEHGIQIGYWTANPSLPPFLTPWAEAGRDVLAAPLQRGPAGGAELLHLVGNLWFMGGLLLLWAVWRYDGADAPLRTAEGQRLLPWAAAAQLFHVVEHIVLTSTFMFWGSSLGFSNGFGLVPSGPVGGATRVWMHFVLNAIPTVLVGVALWRGRTATQAAGQVAVA